MWQCLKCGEEIEDSFEACWACGTSRDGVEDPLFEPVMDQPELPVALSTTATIRGLKAGAAVSVLTAFLHPFLMLFLSYLTKPAALGLNALRPVLAFGFVWAAFAAVGGGIAGAIGARVHTERSALLAGLVSCVLFHILFLTVATNAFGHWSAVIVLGSLSIAAVTGTLAGYVGLVVGRRAEESKAGRG
jgi:hypothetical protein